jgi:magnesium transporter
MAIQPLEVQSAVDTLQFAIAQRDRASLRDTLRNLPSDDAANALDRLSPLELASVFTLLGDEGLALALENLDASDAARLLLKLSRAQAADVLEEMDPDDAADVVEALHPAEAEAILTEMEATEAADVRELLAYPPNSAGSLMTQEVVTLNPDLTAEQALVAIRRAAQQAETIYYVYVTDNQDRLLGVVALRDLVLAAPNTPISALTNRQLVRVRANEDQEVAARMLADRGFLALPVVDDQDRLVGIITVDDVAEVLEEEATEDITRLGGSDPLDDSYLRTSVLTHVRKRIVWLLLLFVGGALTSSVLASFDETLSAVAALTWFIPLLIGTGGNVGSQTVGLLVRGMAVGEVRFGDLGRVLRKELGVALLMGGVMGAAGLARALLLGTDVAIGLTVALAAVGIVLWSSVVSATLPLLIRRAGADPAVVSAPLITTLVDATGLFLYLSIARVLLDI